MVAIVSGNNNLGLSLSSLSTLGQRGCFSRVGVSGRAAQAKSVYGQTAATGNLVLPRPRRWPWPGPRPCRPRLLRTLQQPRPAQRRHNGDKLVSKWRLHPASSNSPAPATTAGQAPSPAHDRDGGPGCLHLQHRHGPCTAALPVGMPSTPSATTQAHQPIRLDRRRPPASRSAMTSATTGRLLATVDHQRQIPSLMATTSQLATSPAMVSAQWRGPPTSTYSGNNLTQGAHPSSPAVPPLKP